ncbi:hypothetical protein A2783_00295 [Microgenomates group bacterium RIFCSPHIGHO2_01_FULL_45_11]|nr:MAG: hypothetical protein A2783_00295 [Microgenomates group bacterium RIFCSPHIGHO2_01_FULL_45_11]
MKSFLLKIWQLLKLPKNLQLFVVRKVEDQFLVGATGVVFNDQNQILLLKHTYRGPNSWHLPAGYIKAGEHPKEGLEREIKEETGFTVSIDDRLKIRTDRDSPRLEIIYLGAFIGGDFRPSAEVSAAKFFSFDKLPSLPKDQLIFINRAFNKNTLPPT